MINGWKLQHKMNILGKIKRLQVSVLQATAVNKISHQYLYCIVRDRKYILRSYPSLVEELSVCLVGRVHHYGVGDLDQEGQ